MSDIYFYKGQKNLLKDKEEKVAVEEIQKELLQVFDVQNLSFLFGAGCSSHVVEGNEVGIPVMAPMAEEFYGELEVVDKTYKAFWLFINQSIQSLPLKENLNEEDFAKLRTNFNIGSLGKLCVTYKHYIGIKKRFEYLRKIRGNENKRRDREEKT